MHSATVAVLVGLSLVMGSVGCKKKPTTTTPDAGPVAVVDAAAAPIVDASAPLDEVVDAAATLAPTVVDAGHHAAAGPIPFVVGESWSGTYNCGANNTMVLKITAVSGNHVNGVFDFKMHNKKTGAFTMSGNYDPATRHILLNAGTWIDQPTKGVDTLNLDGVVSEDKKSYAGKVTGPNARCQAFSSRR